MKTEPLKDKLTENRFVRLFLYGMNRDFENHKPLYPTEEQSVTLQTELRQQFEIIKKDVKSAVEGLRHDMFEWCTDEDDMNAVEIMIKKWFPDVID